MFELLFEVGFFLQHPPLVINAILFFAKGVTDTPNHKMNPLHSILEKFEEDDLVIVELDIDTSSIELPLTKQLLRQRRILPQAY